MLMQLGVSLIVCLGLSANRDSRVDSARYGVSFFMPEDWVVTVRERDEYVVLAKVPQADADQPGAFACEIGLAPEGLEEYKTRIDANAARGRLNGKLVRNEVVRAPGGERLVTVREFQPPELGTWHEVTVRVVANRQMYTFTLNVDDPTHTKLRGVLGDLIDLASFTPPKIDVVRDPIDAERPQPRNRWVHEKDRFVIELPDGWRPVLAPAEVARFFGVGPARGIWSDNVLVLARPIGEAPAPDWEKMAKKLPEDLKREDAGCEVLRCEVVKRGESPTLETIVRTRRGPFSMTVLEHRFRGRRLDIEVKYTIESTRFDDLLPILRKGLETFEELEAPPTGKTNEKAGEKGLSPP